MMSFEKLKEIVKGLQKTQEHRYFTGSTLGDCDFCEEECCDACEECAYDYYDVIALGRIFGIYDIENLDREKIAEVCQKYQDQSGYKGGIGYDLKNSENPKIRFVIFEYANNRPYAKQVEFDTNKCISTDVDYILDHLLDEVVYCAPGHKVTEPFSAGVELIPV